MQASQTPMSPLLWLLILLFWLLFSLDSWSASGSLGPKLFPGDVLEQTQAGVQSYSRMADSQVLTSPLGSTLAGMPLGADSDHDLTMSSTSYP